MIRRLISKLNRSLSEKMVPARRRYTAPVKVWFDPDINSERHRLSRSGIGFLAPSIRISEKYLVGHDRPLNIEIDLPNGKVRMTAIGRRYKKGGAGPSDDRFLIGAQISSYGPGSEEAYLHFLKNGRRSRKTAGELELGID